MRSGVFLAAMICAITLLAQAPASVDKPQGYSRIPIVVGQDAQPITVRFWVDANDSVAFALPSARRDHRLIYTDPNGQIWDTVAPALDTSESWNPPDPTLIPERPGILYHIVVNKPARGRWTLTIQTPSPAAEPLITQLLVFYQNNVAACMTTPKTTLVSGKSLPVTLGLIDGSIKGKNLQITSTLSKEGNPDSLPSKVSFFDDGTHGDPIANDSSYTAVIPTGIAGKFHLEAKVEGFASTGQYQRSCGLDFKVVAQAARFTGNIVQHLRAGVPEFAPIQCLDH